MTRSAEATEKAASPVRQYSKGEEIANSVSHGVGALLSIAALVLLIFAAQVHGGGIRLVAALLMGCGLVIEYTFSTLYHAIPKPEVKRRLPTRTRARIVLTRDPDGGERCVACYLCSAVCPVSCIPVRPDRVESREQLMDKYRQLTTAKAPAP